MKSMIVNALLVLIVFSNVEKTFAVQTKETKGLLPEVTLDSTDEDKNQDKLYKSEILITKTEKKAIEALQRIVLKKKGQPEEADLSYRLAELYMRRSKSGRYFDLNSDLSKKTTLSHTAAESLNDAIKIYSRILTEFPKYENTDIVLFNIALANLQLNQDEKAKTYYIRLTTEFTKSKIYPEGLLELGELYYNQKNMNAALEQFKKIENYPDSKAYPYGAYKSAWCYYNLKENDQAIKKLKSIIAKNPANSSDVKRFNLRKEALQDLTLFVEDVIPAENLYTFFKDITTDDEFGKVMLKLTDLYDSHSHHKEINIFLKEFIEKNKTDANVSQFYTKLIEVNETIKSRELVLSYMQKLSDHCSSGDVSIENEKNCKVDFRKVSLDISKKWWDIWLKNKKHQEFSNLTEKVFEILLAKDNLLDPDSNSRFAYSELLFQVGKFEKAFKNYEIVSQNKKFENSKKHDALYGAIYSIDKLVEADKKSETAFNSDQLRLTSRYIEEFPKGEHIEPLRFKLGFLAYQEQDTMTALKYLTPLTDFAKDAQLKLKSEDIILDIYNLKKDFKLLQSFSQKVLNQKPNAERFKNLQQINQEARFSQMQIDLLNLTPEKRIDTLTTFAIENKSSKLAKEALWQSISLAFSNGFEIKGASLSLNYFEQFPQDPKSIDSLKDALKSYTDAGYISDSIKTIQVLSNLEPTKKDTYIEMTCDLYFINSQVNESQKCYQTLLIKSDKTKRKILLEKLTDTLAKNQNLYQIPGLEEYITKENIEPYVTQILIEKARNLLAKGQTQEAFQLSLRINSRDVDSDVRAEARLIQAEILEKEFISQSVKSSESKFSMVLGIKTEKLDKAYTAYTSTIKMAKSTKIHEKALLGIDRIYSHFIDSLTTMSVPKSLSKADQDALKNELAKMTQPFDVKRIENLQKLSQITAVPVQNQQISWGSMKAEQTISPQIIFPEASKLNAYLPSEFAKYSRLPSEASDTKKCDSKTTTAVSIGSCILSKKYSIAESQALTLTATKENRALGFYYMSVIADLNNQVNKSTWFIDKALKLDSDISMFNYQKGKLVYSTKNLDTALPYFEKAIELKKNSKEISLISGIKSFSDKDFISASDELKKLNFEDQDKFSVSTVLVESTAQKGNSAEAISLAQKYIVNNPKNVDMYLQLGRLFEEFPDQPETAKKKAVDTYTKALAQSQNSEQKSWLERKISFLNKDLKPEIEQGKGG